MKTKLFFVALLTIALMSFCSCADTEDKDTDGTESDSTVSSSDSSENKEDVLEIPLEYDFEGQTVNILVSGNYANDDFNGDITSPDIVMQNQYKRNVEVEEQYKVKIEVDNKIAFGSQKTGSGPAFSAFQLMYTSQSYDYDFATIGTYNAGSCAYNGYLTDLNSLPNIDLSKSWWSQSANGQLEINGKMYFTTGDITLADNKVTHLIVFNKDLLSSKGLESPYDAVKNGKWTWDYFSDQVKKISVDLNGDDVMNEKDMYGCMTWADAYAAAVASAGSQIAGINDNGELTLTLMSDRTTTIVEKYAQMIFDTNTCFDYQYGYASSTWDTNRYGMFSGGQVAYYLASAVLPGAMREYDVNFGIIPYPKLDEEQEEYYSLAAAYHNQYIGVPYFVEDPERTGMLLEILAYKGKEYVTPAFYEKQLVGTYIRDDESEQMLDIIYKNVVFDPGLIYRISGMSDTFNSVRTQRTNVFASQYEWQRKRHRRI